MGGIIGFPQSVYDKYFKTPDAPTPEEAFKLLTKEYRRIGLAPWVMPARDNFLYRMGPYLNRSMGLTDNADVLRKKEEVEQICCRIAEETGLDIKVEDRPNLLEGGIAMCVRIVNTAPLQND